MSERIGERVIYAMLTTATRLACRQKLGVRPLRQLLEMAHFHEASKDGRPLRDVAVLLDISPRKAAQLSKQLKLNFLEPSVEIGLPRRVEFLLWAAPLSRKRIRQALDPVDEGDLDNALATLVREGRVIVKKESRREVYHRVRSNSRLVGDGWSGRIDGLQHLLDNLANVIYARFFRDDRKAFARTISVQLRAEDLPELERIYESVWERVTALEASARDDPNALHVDLSMFWGPDQKLGGGERGSS
ncbi:MAG: hypothetical protein AAGE52_18970 [Myxococcota bacterium]